jgi:HTH-type transcriptional regulator/antitoxin MqsA
MTNLSHCPACGAGDLIHDIRDIHHLYKGESITILNCEGDFCSACGESIFDYQESERVTAEMLAFNKQVNASYVSPEFIASVRKKLNLEQKEAAALFGGGVNAFSRYETGKTKPNLALVQLFKLLDHHPNLLSELR